MSWPSSRRRRRALRGNHVVRKRPGRRRAACASSYGPGRVAHAPGRAHRREPGLSCLPGFCWPHGQGRRSVTLTSVSGFPAPGLSGTAREAARRFGDTVAFVDGRTSLTYAELDRHSDEVAAGMASRGVSYGDVVALVLPTTLDYPVCYLAAAKLGAITAGINTRLAADERQQLIDLVRPALVVDDAAVAADLRQAGEAPPEVPDDPEHPVAIVFTSGTTGTPRGAVFAGRQLAAIRGIDVGNEWGRGGASLAGT